MSRARLGPVPEGARVRLLGHYGEPVLPWLRRVPEWLADAAARHGMVEVGYHDWGHASVIAHGRTAAGQGVVLKAVFDPRRLAEESAAFAFWKGQAVPPLIAVEEDLGVLVTELVEPGPGGAERPEMETALVAEALGRLHECEPTGVRDVIPSLAEYYTGEVTDRMAERDEVTGRVVDRALVSAASGLALSMPTVGGERVLHADLYRENVLFAPEGRAVFIDPLPKIGPPVFDWAFWSVYYDFHRGFEERLHIAVDKAANADALVPWCLLLAVDGLLYFLSIEDSERAARAGKIIEALRESGRDGTTITAR